MRKIILVATLMVLVVTHFTAKHSMHVQNRPLVFNGEFTKKSVTRLWLDIRSLHRQLPADEPIHIYMSSNGGVAQETTVLLERIGKLKREGRQFIGTIYGYCFSACGSLFASMSKRYMTINAVYMQHLSFMPGVRINPTMVKLGLLVDTHRLKNDAAFFKQKTEQIITSLTLTDYIYTAEMLLHRGLIDGIVEQPDIDGI
jgi:ATP-dependent protease ClpP protease subunit